MAIVEKKQQSFDSVAGVIFSCLGCVIGTGNIWRFPRILARNSGNHGAAGFFIVWLVSLFTWSIPVLVIEYSMGRYVRKSPIRCFFQFIGRAGLVLGGWVAFINFFIGSYYMAILSWCVYYIYLPMSIDLPSEETNSQEIFNSLVDSKWPFIPYTICFVVIAVSVLGGIKVIEKVNTVLVPVLLIILLSIFFYSTSLKYSEYGFDFLFSIDWATFANPSLYLDAISQNAFDTGAAGGLITAYAMYLTKEHSIMRYSLFIPIINNSVSLLASMTIFPTVFGIMMVKDSTLTQSGIVDIIKNGGLAGTGLTFIWIPILLQTMGVAGRVLCSIFFICLSFAGISSFISILEMLTITLMEFGLQRKFAVLIMSATMYLFGAISVLKLDFLINQDFVWGFALILSGCMYIGLVIRFGPFNFRSRIVNAEKSKNDFSLPIVWPIIIYFLAPLQAASLLIWWIYSEIKEHERTWYIPGWSSLMTTWIEWFMLASLLTIGAAVVIKLRVQWTVNFPKLSSNTVRMTQSVYRNHKLPNYESHYLSTSDSVYNDSVADIHRPSEASVQMTESCGGVNASYF